MSRNSGLICLKKKTAIETFCKKSLHLGLDKDDERQDTNVEHPIGMSRWGVNALFGGRD